MGQAKIRLKNGTMPAFVNVQVAGDELQNAISTAKFDITQRPYAGRNAVGKMIKCQDCKLRHRLGHCHRTKEWYIRTEQINS